MNFLDKVFKELREGDARLLREILMADESPVTRAEADLLLDTLRIQKIRQELRDVDECLRDPATSKTALVGLAVYGRGLRRLLEPQAVRLRELFCLYLAERERKRANGD